MTNPERPTESMTADEQARLEIVKNWALEQGNGQEGEPEFAWMYEGQPTLLKFDELVAICGIKMVRASDEVIRSTIEKTLARAESYKENPQLAEYARNVGKNVLEKMTSRDQ